MAAKSKITGCAFGIRGCGDGISSKGTGSRTHAPLPRYLAGGVLPSCCLHVGVGVHQARNDHPVSAWHNLHHVETGYAQQAALMHLLRAAWQRWAAGAAAAAPAQQGFRRSCPGGESTACHGDMVWANFIENLSP